MCSVSDLISLIEPLVLIEKTVEESKPEKTLKRPRNTKKKEQERNSPPQKKKKRKLKQP